MRDPGNEVGEFVVGSLLALSVFSGFSSFPPSTKINTSKILIRSGISGWRATSWKYHCKFVIIIIVIVIVIVVIVKKIVELASKSPWLTGKGIRTWRQRKTKGLWFQGPKILSHTCRLKHLVPVQNIWYQYKVFGTSTKYFILVQKQIVPKIIKIEQLLQHKHNLWRAFVAGLVNNDGVATICEGLLLLVLSIMME